MTKKEFEQLKKLSSKFMIQLAKMTKEYMAIFGEEIITEDIPISMDQLYIEEKDLLDYFIYDEEDISIGIMRAGSCGEGDLEKWVKISISQFCNRREWEEHLVNTKIILEKQKKEGEEYSKHLALEAKEQRRKKYESLKKEFESKL